MPARTADHSLQVGGSIAGEEWSRTLEGWEPTSANALWRAHSDAVNLGLLRRWLAGERFERVLKTDLFDEAVGEGLVGELQQRAGEVIGIDIAPAVVEAAAGRIGVSAMVADVRALPFESGSFDLVVSNSTLDHFHSVDELVQALGELFRITRPGGRLLITLDNRQNPVVALRTSRAFAGAFRRLGLVPYDLGVTCGRRRLCGLLDRVGFDVQATDAIMHCPPQVASRLAERFGAGADPADLQREHLRRVLRFEALSRWPTRYLTAHFVAVCGRRRPLAGAAR